MPGDNCSIEGCPVSRSSKYKGIGIFKVPSGNTEHEKNWRDKLVNIVTRDRVIDPNFRERINSRKVFICQRHYSEDQVLIHDSRKTLKPGELPHLNLPIKSHPSKPVVPRASAESIANKKRLLFREPNNNHQLSML